MINIQQVQQNNICPSWIALAEQAHRDQDSCEKAYLAKLLEFCSVLKEFPDIVNEVWRPPRLDFKIKMHIACAAAGIAEGVIASCSA